MPGLKRRAIKSVIESKLKAWLKTMPEEFAEKVKDHLIVSGGCIASMLLGETVNDYDVYTDDVLTAKRLANYYVAKFNANRVAKNNFRTSEPYVRVSKNLAGEEVRVAIYVKSVGVAGESEDPSQYQYFETQAADNVGADEYVQQLADKKEETEEDRYRPIFLSENAITLSNKLQIVIRFTGVPEEIHKNYDYVHATNYYYSRTKQLVFRPSALEALLSKTLNYQGSLYPVCSLFRMRKFMDRGWKISAGEIIKISMQISALDLRDIKVLREQLIGVDAAYMHELLAMLTTYTQNDQTKPIEASYVMQLVDMLAEQEHGI